MRVNSSLCRGCSKWLTLPADHLRSQIYSGASNSPLSAFSTDAFMMLQAANRRRWPGCTETEIRFRADYGKQEVTPLSAFPGEASATTHSEQLAWINLLGSRNVALSLLGYEIY